MKRRGSGVLGSPPEKRVTRRTTAEASELEARSIVARAALAATRVLVLNQDLAEFLKRDPMALVSLRACNSEYAMVARYAFRIQLAITGRCFKIDLSAANLVFTPVGKIYTQIRTFGDQIYFVSITNYNCVLDVDRETICGPLRRVLHELETCAMNNLEKNTNDRIQEYVSTVRWIKKNNV